jgi:D-methionine transport system ATP-binding protein
MIEINEIYKSFNKNTVLKDVSIHIDKGEIFGIIGHSGAGKSTLLRCINGLEQYDKGCIKAMDREVGKLNSKEIRDLRKDVGMIFQNFNLLNRKNVFQNAALPMEVWGFDNETIKKKVVELLELVGLKDKIYSMPSELSGGQKQRVAIARALALNPKILLCDEATSALDPKTTKDILQLLKKINEQLNITVVIVTHQMEVIKEVCSRIALMEDGEVKAYGKADELFLKPSNEMKKLLGEEDNLPNKGINIRIFFPSSISQQCIITTMARELNIDFSIVWGKLEKFRDNVLGSLVINTDLEHEEKIIKYLNSINIGCEVV